MFRSVVASSLMIVALCASTGCGASATPAASTAVASARHDSTWYPAEETEFAFRGDAAERPSRPETAHNLEQPNRNEIPRGSIHAATN
ncbi:hypothetical protein AKJ09_03055 [Labilithrix luteola]|uniref:Secreted protein n=1 Tax=Labilithrix luteola TaxID=1391654 RepID=A0A0K1PSP9_9BACT|nr:hypothetical protein [Labilithrix luteola]AKU96391.1 hypothetical protein AKJ09_03055 [Labilithrix luteola]